MKHIIIRSVLALLALLSVVFEAYTQSHPLKIGVAGLSHSHVRQLLKRPNKGDINIVGIYESDTALAEHLAGLYGFSMDIVYNDLDDMLEKTRPEAVTAFGSIYDHLKIVKACAPMGIHVMVEKPLSANLEQALEMERLAKSYSIHLITNYETSWYPTLKKIYSLQWEEKVLGEIRKIIVCDGHSGPKEIGVNQEFLNWLTDPVLNGGGAIMDFGCYGANLVTWLLQGEVPEYVFAVTDSFKPEIYSKVDDEATIILTYPGTHCLIQASWNWPFPRKDLEIYGVNTYAKAVNATELKLRFSKQENESIEILEANQYPFNDPFSYLAALIRGRISPERYDASSLENNIIVMRILDAAIKSANTGQKIRLNPDYLP